MTRREKEIHKASISWKDEVIIVKEEKAFVVGAQWADKTMIDKACKWLEDIDYVMQYQYSEDGCTFFNKDKFIKDFRKAMEE